MLERFQDHSRAFLNLALGGSGRLGMRQLHALHRADGRPFTTLFVSIDTDPEPEPSADVTISLALDAEKVEVLRADPRTFGPVAEVIVEHYDRFLDPEDIGNGARTMRLLTQLSFAYHRQQLIDRLRATILMLERQGGFRSIIPVFLSSSGGGTGSALQILLAQALKDRAFASQLTEGLPGGLLQRPIGFVVEPFAYALRHRAMHADKVLGNAYAFRLESAYLEAQGAFKYIYHLGLANEHGAVLDTTQEIAKVLGTSVYQYERAWPLIKSRLVDTVDTHALTGSYSGRDVPEFVLRGNGQPVA